MVETNSSQKVLLYFKNKPVKGFAAGLEAARDHIKRGGPYSAYMERLSELGIITGEMDALEMTGPAVALEDFYADHTSSCDATISASSKEKK